MSTAIAIHWTEQALHYVAAEAGGVVAEAGGVAAEADWTKASASIVVDPGMDTTTMGHRLAEALAPYSPGRAKVVVAISRGALDWQHLSLPPCPADELPNLVRLQSDQDISSSGEDVGFDFLSLVGDEHTPYQVLTVALASNELTKIQQVCRAASLTLERIVPLAIGWPAITKQASPDSEPSTRIFVAPQANEATLWAARAGRVVLFRQFQLGTTEDQTALASAVGGELRRTLLALSQQSNNGKPSITLVGQQQDQLAALAHALGEQLDVAVQSLNVAAKHSNLVAESTTATSTLQLAGLAIDESQGNQPLVDLLHPHQRPQAQVNVRTYALAAAAGLLLVTLFGWLSYAKLQAPLNQAAEDQAELTLLEEPLDKLQEYEQRAGAIRDWNAEAPNLLAHLQQVSQCLRPQSLAAENFSVDQDVVQEKLDLEKRRLTINALARNNRAVQPLESRLRESGYRPQRGKSAPSQANKEYPWHFSSTIEITTASDTITESASKPDPVGDAAAEEPQS